MSMNIFYILAAGAVVLFSASKAKADNSLLMGRLVSAYPEWLEKHDGQKIYWRDGTVMLFEGRVRNKTYAEKIQKGSLLDQMSMVYPKKKLRDHPKKNDDPGRVRHTPFFQKMYGNCFLRKAEFESKLVTVVWLEKTQPETIKVSPENNIPDRLRKISAEIEALPDEIRKMAGPTSGVYSCRVVADTKQPSMHAVAAAIDINVKKANYWYWDEKKLGKRKYRNKMPFEIIKIFEKHGFIWGGKWDHYDTMHFEYRPELLND